MPPTNLQHRRTHNLLLINKLLNQRDATSPFTLVLDTLEQPGRLLITEYLKRAKAAKIRTIFVAFETLRQPPNVDIFVPTWEFPTSAAWQSSVASHSRSPPVQSTTTGGVQKTLLVIDALNHLTDPNNAPLPAFLTSLLSPTTSLLALYHLDVPSLGSSTSPYQPSPLTTLKFLATTLLTPHSLHHVLARKAARERSLPEPVFGLAEGVEGLVVGGSAGVGTKGWTEEGGAVIEMEHRRRSGRGVREWFFLPSTASSSTASTNGSAKGGVILLEDHPLYRSGIKDEGGEGEGEMITSTFELGLSEKQRRDREGVVLPYYDAQKADGTGPGEGGRILYDMGAEDDFDEEEDEI